MPDRPIADARATMLECQEHRVCKQPIMCRREGDCYFVQTVQQNLWRLESKPKIAWSNEQEDSDITHHTPYLSPSRLSTYERCPAGYYRRYVMGITEPPTSALAYGSAIHHGLEAHYLGEDADLAFVRAWTAAKRNLVTANIAVLPELTMMGLGLIERVIALNLAGEPERKVWLTLAELPIPFHGIIDLWTAGHLYDFKTTGYPWTQNTVAAQLWQPAIYSMAYALEVDGELPRFSFIVLNRSTGTIQVMDATVTEDQCNQMVTRAKLVYDRIESEDWTCTCRQHAAA